MATRPPKVIGIGSQTSIDIGTLIRNLTPKPGVTGTGSTLEGISWSVPLTRSLANSNVDGWFVAVVYFKTDECKVNQLDRIGLKNLMDSLKKRLKDGFTISLKCTGGADYRLGRRYNKRLAQRRADSVKAAIKSLIPNEKLKISTKSEGEKFALQPKGDKLPSLIRIVNDRNVIVTIAKNGYIAPITIAAVGNWYFNASIESEEMKWGGRIVSVAGVAQKEREYQERRGIKRNENDPLLPTVIIETHFHTAKVDGKEEAFIRCNVIHVKTKELLFSEFERTHSSKVIKEIVHFDPNRPNVKRAYIPGKTNPMDMKGRATQKRTVKGLHERAADLVGKIYNKLKGGRSYKNISERIEARLRTARD
jgi:hypothetical protein